MKVAQIVASVENPAAGPTYSVPRLCKALGVHEGVDVTLCTLGDQGRATAKIEKHIIYPHSRFSGGIGRRLAYSPKLKRGLLDLQSHVYHTHGLWTFANVYPASVAKKNGASFIISPRGMLGAEALAFSKSQKAVFWQLFQRRAADASSCFHATAESEIEDIRNFGISAPVALVPNGVDVPKDDFSITSTRQSVEPYVLSLGRIHPKKRLGRLISAWAQVCEKHPETKLRIIGPDELGYADQLRNLAAEKGISSRVEIEGPVFGEQKFTVMKQASVFVLATDHENFAMTVAESLAAKTPVISTNGAPWSGLKINNCGWWVDRDATAIGVALHEALSMPLIELEMMGARGHDWMRRDFSWQSVSEKMLAVYSWLRFGRDRPDWVFL
ncbi:MAG: glycosyltransferase [Henriciella sp.]